MAEKKPVRFLDFWPVGVLFLIVVWELLRTPVFPYVTASFVVLLGVIQNTAFALSSRARNRNNAIYHLIAVLASSFIFFLMQRTLILENMPLMLAPLYAIGTVIGSFTGTQVSMFIEARLGIMADEKKDEKKEKSGLLMRFLPIGVFSVALVMQLVFLPIGSIWLLLVLVGINYTQSLSHSVVSWFSNRDKHSVHFAASIVRSVLEFFSYDIMLAFKMNWVLFLPSATGGAAGSLNGSQFGSWVGKKIQASADAHLQKERLEIPQALLILPFVIVAVQLFFTPAFLWSAVLVFGVSVIRNFSYTTVSYARNRNNNAFHILAAVFSNGVWYLTLGQLIIAGMNLALLPAFVFGTTVGSISGTVFSMGVARRTKASADAHVLQPKKA